MASGGPPPELPDFWPAETVRISEGSDNRKPDVSVDENGLATVVWRAQVNGQWIIKARSQGDDGFGPAVSLSPPGEPADSPRIASEPDGTTTVVWLSGSGSATSVRAVTRRPGEQFGVPTSLASGSISNLRLEASAGGTVVAWRRHVSGALYDLQARVRRPGQDFGSILNLNPVGQRVDDATVSIGPEGTLAAAWISAYDSILARTVSPSGQLQAATAIESSGGGRRVSSPSVAAGPSGSVVVAWASVETATGTSLVRARLRVGSDAFAAPIEWGSDSWMVGVVRTAIAGNGTVVVAWRQNGVVGGSIKDPGGEFSSPFAFHSDSGALLDPVDLAAGPLGNLALAWETTVGGQNSIRIASRLRLGGSFRLVEPDGIPASASFPSVTLGMAGGPVAVWERSAGPGGEIDLLEGSTIVDIENSGPGSGRTFVNPSGVECGPYCQARVQPGDTVTLVAKPDPGSVIAGWDGACTGTSRTCTVMIDHRRTVGPVFVEGIEVSVAGTGDGEGKVTSEELGIDCGEDCVDHYLPGDKVVLTAEPEPGNLFVGWSGACSGETMKCLLEVGEEPLDVEAEFAPSVRMPDWDQPHQELDLLTSLAELELTTGQDGSPRAVWRRVHGLASSIQLSSAEGTQFGASEGLTGNLLVHVVDEPKFAEGEDGTQLIGWIADRGNLGIKVRTRTPGGDGEFGPIETLTERGSLSDLRIAMTAEGAFVIWRRMVEGKYQLEMTHRAPGGAFGPTVSVSAVGDHVTAPTMAVAPDGRVGFAWLSGAMLRFREWTPANGLGGFSIPAFGWLESPALGYGPQGEAVLGWVRNDGSREQVETATKPPASNFQLPAVPVSGSRGDIAHLRAATGGDRTIAFAWAASRDVEAAVRDDDRARFRPAQVVSGTAPSGQLIGVPQVAVSEDGETAVAWRAEGADGGEVWTASRPPHGGFAPPSTIPTSEDAASDPQVRFDSSGRLFTGWLHQGTDAMSVRFFTRPARVTRAVRVLPQGSGGGTVVSQPPGIECGERCEHDFYVDTRVILTADPAPGDEFVRWEGGRCDGWSGPCVIHTDRDHEIRPVFATGRQLTVNKQEAPWPGSPGHGWVVSGERIDCGTKCSASVESGQEVKLDVYTDSRSSFSGWTGACSGLAPSCTVTMDQARQVTAGFTEGMPLTVKRRGTGTGAVRPDPGWTPCVTRCSGTFPTGETVDLFADAAPGFALDRWTGDCSGNDSPCRVTMEGSREVSAHFVPGHDLSVGRSGTGTGKVVSTPARIDCGQTCESSFPEEAEVTLKAEPDSRDVFAGWSGACSGTSPTCTVTMDQARDVEAEFTRWRQLDVTKTGNGAGAVRSNPDGVECGADCRHVFPPDSEVTLTADAAPGSRFTGWAGACQGTGPTCVIAMSEDLGAIARFEPVYQLNVENDQPGNGRVLSLPSGIDCGTSCVSGLLENTEVTLRAEPAEGSAFVAWSGACNGPELSCTVTMDESKSVSASFAPGHPLILETPGSGSGSVSSTPARLECGEFCETMFAAGTEVTLRADPDAGSAFHSWGGACHGTALTCNVAMDQARSVSANFRPGANLKVRAFGPVAGRVTSDPERIDCQAGESCEEMFPTGEPVTLTARPGPGSAFANWDGACTGSRFTCVVEAGQATEASATFGPGMLLTVQKNGSGSGSVVSSPERLDCGNTCQESFVYQSTVTLTALPTEGSEFAGWSGPCQGASPTCLVPMSATRSVNATFVQVEPSDDRELSVELVGDGHGRVVSAPAGIDCGPTCAGSFEAGTQVRLLAQPEAGSSFNRWEGACEGQDKECTIDLEEAAGVTAVFDVAHSLRVTRAGAGTGKVTTVPGAIDCGSTCTTELGHGTSTTVMATPGLGSYFVGWSGDCSGIEAVCELVVDADRAVTAEFARLLPVVAGTKGNGIVTSQPAGIACGVACSAAFRPETEVTLEAQPEDGSLFSEWSGSCAGQGAVCVIPAGRGGMAEATFVPAGRLNVNVAGSGAGRVQSQPAGIDCGDSCSADLPDGSRVTLTADAAPGSTFSGWTGCEGRGTTCVIDLDGRADVQATFDADGPVCTSPRTIIRRPKLDRRLRHVTIPVWSSEPGIARIRGTRMFRQATKRVRSSGTTRVTLTLKPKAKKTLRRKGNARIRLALSLDPATGCPGVTRRTTVTLNGKVRNRTKRR